MFYPVSASVSMLGLAGSCLVDGFDTGYIAANPSGICFVSQPVFEISIERPVAVEFFGARASFVSPLFWKLYTGASYAMFSFSGGRTHFLYTSLGFSPVSVINIGLTSVLFVDEYVSDYVKIDPQLSYTEIGWDGLIGGVILDFERVLKRFRARLGFVLHSCGWFSVAISSSFFGVSFAAGTEKKENWNFFLAARTRRFGLLFSAGFRLLNRNFALAMGVEKEIYSRRILTIGLFVPLASGIEFARAGVSLRFEL